LNAIDCSRDPLDFPTRRSSELTATGSPYSFTWTAVPAGNYSLTAKATDNQGAAATSVAVSITVNPANVSPSVIIISPTNGAVLIDRKSTRLNSSHASSYYSVAQ